MDYIMYSTVSYSFPIFSLALTRYWTVTSSFIHELVTVGIKSKILIKKFNNASDLWALLLFNYNIPKKL